MDYIYGLVDDGQLFYVGKTSNPKRRLTAHRARFGSNIMMRILEEVVGGQDWKKREVCWIAEMGRRGHRLCNITCGGNGPRLPYSEEALIQRSERTRRLWQDPEFREKMSVIMQDPDYRQRMSEASRARWQEPEFREKMLAIKQSPEYRERVSQSVQDLWLDSEYRAQQKESRAEPEYLQVCSEQAKKQWQDPGRREQGRRIAKEQWQDPEHRKKMSEVTKARWQDPEYREQRAEAMRQQWQDPEYRAKCIEGLEKHARKPEVRKRRSEIMKEKWQDPEFRTKIVEALKGNQNRKGHSPSKETRRKISIALRGREPWNKGKCLSDETKHKIGIGNAKAYPAFRHRKTGEVIPAGRNLCKLCRRRELIPSHMRAVKNGERNHHKGWELLREVE